MLFFGGITASRPVLKRFYLDTIYLTRKSFDLTAQNSLLILIAAFRKELTTTI